MQQLFTDQMHAVPEATNSCDAVSITMMVTLFVCFFAAYLFIWCWNYRTDRSWAHFTPNLPRILAGLLTGHADLNWYLHIMDLRQDSICPLCQEEEDTTAHFIAQCSALMLLCKIILGEYILSLDTLSNIHWFLLLKFAKASKGFYGTDLVVCWGCALGPCCGLSVGCLLTQSSTPQVR